MRIKIDNEAKGPRLEVKGRGSILMNEITPDKSLEFGHVAGTYQGRMHFWFVAYKTTAGCYGVFVPELSRLTLMAVATSCCVFRLCTSSLFRKACGSY